MNMLSTNTQKTMTSKELLELVNAVRISFGEPLIRLNKFNEKIEDELDGDYCPKSVVKNSNNTESTVYKLTLEQCTLIGMRESKGVRKSVLAKIKELEKPQELSRMDILQIAMEAEKENIELKETIQIQAPKVEFYDKIVDCTGLSSATQVALKHNLTARELNNMLYDLEVYSLNMDPKKGKVFRKWFIDQGYGKMKHHVGSNTQPMFTLKGEQWIFDNI